MNQLNFTKILPLVAVIYSVLVDVAFAEPFTNWKYQNDGSSNYHCYETKKLVPKGSEIRIKIVKVGDGFICIENEDGALKTFSGDKGEILKFTIPRGQKIRVASCYNYWRPGNVRWNAVKGISVKDDYHTMSFADGLVINVKIVAEEF
jgi:hypothetical protein